MTKETEALKLAKIALEDTEHPNFKRRRLDARIAIHDALAQPVQEPVAWADKQSLDQIANFDATIYAKGGFDNATPLYTTPPLPVQEPVGSVVRWLDGSLVHGWFSDPPPEGTLLYITPPAVQPQRPWVGLTNKELFEILDKANTRYQALQMTEDKLKEKNA